MDESQRESDDDSETSISQSPKKKRILAYIEEIKNEGIKNDVKKAKMDIEEQNNNDSNNNKNKNNVIDLSNDSDEIEVDIQVKDVPVLSIPENEKKFLAIYYKYIGSTRISCITTDYSMNKNSFNNLLGERLKVSICEIDEFFSYVLEKDKNSCVSSQNHYLNVEMVPHMFKTRSDNEVKIENILNTIFVRRLHGDGTVIFEDSMISDIVNLSYRKEANERGLKGILVDSYFDAIKTRILSNKVMVKLFPDGKEEALQGICSDLNSTKHNRECNLSGWYKRSVIALDIRKKMDDISKTDQSSNLLLFIPVFSSKDKGNIKDFVNSFFSDTRRVYGGHFTLILIKINVHKKSYDRYHIDSMYDQVPSYLLTEYYKELDCILVDYVDLKKGDTFTRDLCWQMDDHNCGHFVTMFCLYIKEKGIIPDTTTKGYMTNTEKFFFTVAKELMKLLKELKNNIKKK